MPVGTGGYLKRRLRLKTADSAPFTFFGLTLVRRRRFAVNSKRLQLYIPLHCPSRWVKRRIRRYELAVNTCLEENNTFVADHSPMVLVLRT